MPAPNNEESRNMSGETGDSWVQRCVNLAQPRLGAAVVASTDEFFAPAQRMLSPEEPVFVPGKFDDHGKWMDGWETRRRRDAGHDHCVVRLGCPGIIRGVEIDTRHFTGNYPPAASLEACYTLCDPGMDTTWTEIVPALDLRGDERRFARVDDQGVYSHVRLHIYPDGGIARLRVYGEVRPDPDRLKNDAIVDWAALENGGRIVACNDAHFGSPWNLLSPGRGVNMGDGWETRRRRAPGHDWVIVALGCVARLERIEVDTAHFKGNYPDRCSLQAAYVDEGTDQALATQSMFWPQVLAAQPLRADTQHTFAVSAAEPVTHVKLNILPDGGVSRLRVYARAARSAA